MAGFITFRFSLPIVSIPYYPGVFEANFQPQLQLLLQAQLSPPPKMSFASLSGPDIRIGGGYLPTGDQTLGRKPPMRLFILQ